MFRQVALMACFICPLAFAQPAVRLTTHELPPYSFTTADGKQAGVAVKAVICVFERLKLPLQIEFLPWARAQTHARQGVADGFFAASYSAERDSWAVMSLPIAPQQWRWYLRSDSSLDPKSENFRQEAKVASFVGANMLTWLQEKGYRVEATPFTNQQLLDMLLGRRLDAILANHLVMQELTAESRTGNAVRSVLEQDRPLGVYFSKVFLAKAGPDFLPRFNQTIPGCVR